MSVCVGGKGAGRDVSHRIVKKGETEKVTDP